MHHVRLGAIHVRFVGPGVDLEEEVALLDLAALGEMMERPGVSPIVIALGTAAVLLFAALIVWWWV